MEKSKRGAVAMSEIAKAYVQIEPTFNGVQAKIEQEMGGAGESGGKSFGSGFAKVLGGAGQLVAGAAKLTAGAVAAGSVAVTGLVKSATDSYAEYEQLAGGVELLFGRSAEETEALRQSMLESGMSAKQVTEELANMSDASDIVMKNAESAFSRVQMSTNDYLQTANSFATGLKESLGGDSEAAANLADRIIVAQADVVAATGNNAENVANAFAGIMKNNFTMLDNLQLGIKPTKEGMQEVIDKMNELNGTNYEMGNLADMQSAIVDYIDYVGMAGYAQNEASDTIQGSLATLSAAWDNLLTGMGNKDADLSALIDNLVQSAQTFIGNMLPIIEQALMGVSSMITELAPVIAQELPGLLQSVLPMLLTAGADIIQTLAQGLLTAIPDLLPTITDLVLQLSQMLIEMLPQLIEVGAQVILSLAMGIAQALPELIPTIVQVVLDICMYLIENIDLLLDAATQLMIGLATGLINAIPVLIEKAPVIIIKLVAAFLLALVKLDEVGQKLIETIKTAIDQYLPGLLAKGSELMNKLKAKISEKVKEFTQIGKNIIEGIKKGISDAWESLQKWFGEKISGLVSGVKDLLGIESPSKVFANEVGKMIPLGIAQGMEDEMGVVDDTIKAMTTGMVDMGVSASVSQQVMMGTSQADPIAAITSLLSTYLPVIAAGENQHIYLEGDAGRLFRLMQRESVRNTQIVGTNAVLASTT